MPATNTADLPNDQDTDDQRAMLRVRAFTNRAYLLTDCTVRADGSGRIVEAYAAAFNAPAEIRDEDGHYNEVVARTAFDKTIAEQGMNIGVFYNHARTIDGAPSGSLSVPIGVPVEAPRADEHGLFTVTEYLDNPLADTILDAVKKRALKAQSFSGRFIKSMRTRALSRGALGTITRQEVALREYGPAAFAAYLQAHIVGTRSADAFLSDLVAMDPADRADLFRQMQALAATTPLGEPEQQPLVTANRAAGRADEPRQHSARQSDIALRIRAGLTARSGT